MQGGIIALILGAILRHMPASAPTSFVPYAIFGYGLLAAFLPWVTSITGGLVLSDDLTPGVSVALGILFALPAYVASRWFAPTSYHLLGIGCWVLIAGWGVHLLATVIASLRRRPAA